MPPSSSLSNSVVPLLLSRLKQAGDILIHVPILAPSRSPSHPHCRSPLLCMRSRFHLHIRLQTLFPLFHNQVRLHQLQSAIPTPDAAPPCPPAASRRRLWAFPYRPFPLP